MFNTNTNENLVGVFDNEDTLINAIKNIKKSSFKIKNVFTPYPIHEVFHELELTTRLPFFAFLYAAGGMILVFAFIYWTSVINYTISIGGKPDLNMSYIVCMFVMTILFGIVLSVGTFFTIQRLFPGKSPVIINESIMDDKFVIVIEKKSDMSDGVVAEINKLFISNGAIETGFKNNIEDI